MLTEANQGNESQLLVRLSERGLQAFEAGFRPELARLVVIPEDRRSFRQLEPLHFPACEDVHVRLRGARLVERADAHKSEIGLMPIIAPDGGLTLGAAVDIVRSVFASDRHCYGFAADQLDCLGLDDRIEHERTACQPLAVVAMTAVDEHRMGEELVADGPAGTATSKFLCHGD